MTANMNAHSSSSNNTMIPKKQPLNKKGNAVGAKRSAVVTVNHDPRMTGRDQHAGNVNINHKQNNFAGNNNMNGNSLQQGAGRAVRSSSLGAAVASSRNAIGISNGLANHGGFQNSNNDMRLRPEPVSFGDNRNTNNIQHSSNPRARSTSARPRNASNRSTSSSQVRTNDVLNASYNSVQRNTPALTRQSFVVEIKNKYTQNGKRTNLVDYQATVENFLHNDKYGMQRAICNKIVEYEVMDFEEKEEVDLGHYYSKDDVAWKNAAVLIKQNSVFCKAVCAYKRACLDDYFRNGNVTKHVKGRVFIDGWIESDPRHINGNARSRSRSRISKKSNAGTSKITTSRAQPDIVIDYLADMDDVFASDSDPDIRRRLSPKNNARQRSRTPLWKSTKNASSKHTKKSNVYESLTRANRVLGSNAFDVVTRPLARPVDTEETKNTEETEGAGQEIRWDKSPPLKEVSTPERAENKNKSKSSGKLIFSSDSAEEINASAVGKPAPKDAASFFKDKNSDSVRRRVVFSSQATNEDAEMMISEENKHGSITSPKSNNSQKGTSSPKKGTKSQNNDSINLEFSSYKHDKEPSQFYQSNTQRTPTKYANEKYNKRTAADFAGENAENSDLKKGISPLSADSENSDLNNARHEIDPKDLEDSQDDENLMIEDEQINTENSGFVDDDEFGNSTGKYGIFVEEFTTSSPEQLQYDIAKFESQEILNHLDKSNSKEDPKKDKSNACPTFKFGDENMGSGEKIKNYNFSKTARDNFIQNAGNITTTRGVKKFHSLPSSRLFQNYQDFQPASSSSSNLIELDAEEDDEDSEDAQVADPVLSGHSRDSLIGFEDDLIEDDFDTSALSPTNTTRNSPNRRNANLTPSPRKNFECAPDKETAEAWSSSPLTRC